MEQRVSQELALAERERLLNEHAQDMKAIYDLYTALENLDRAYMNTEKHRTQWARDVMEEVFYLMKAFGRYKESQKGGIHEKN